MARNRTGEDGLRDPRHRHAQVQRDLHGPAAGALLLGRVGHDVDERAPGRCVGVGEHLRRDLDQVRVQPAPVPRPEGLRDLRGGVAGDLAQQVVGLGDELHVGVLDAVVHHLDEVSGAVGADVRDARRTVGGLRRDLLEHRTEGGVRLGGTARHDARAEQRTLLAARDAGAHEVDALLAQLLLAPPGVLEVRVAAVDDDVARLQQRGELADHGIGRLPGLHHDDQAARPLQRVHELLRGLGGDEGPLVPELLHQRGGLRGRPVVDGDGEAVAGEVPGEVAPHHREPGDTDLGRAAHACAPECFDVRVKATLHGQIYLQIPRHAKACQLPRRCALLRPLSCSDRAVRLCGS